MENFWISMSARFSGIGRLVDKVKRWEVKNIKQRGIDCFVVI
jgi:hypothetical protein